jgi:hypothetical protein
MDVVWILWLADFRDPLSRKDVTPRRWGDNFFRNASYECDPKE